MIHSPAVLDFLTAAYDHPGTPESWTSNLLGAVMRMVGATSGAWFDFDAHTDSNQQFRLDSIALRAILGPSVQRPRHSLALWNQVPPPMLVELFGKSLANTFRTLVRDVEPALIPAWRELWLPPIADNLGLVARQPNGKGTLAIAGVSETLRPSRQDARLLNRLSFHFAAASRLRDAALLRPLDSAEAILTHTGRVLHAGNAASRKLVSIEDGRARRAEALKRRDDAPKALEIWRGLIAGRWSLVEHFDTDGKRFLLARKNPPRVDRRADLTPRERRVTALAAMGHRDKEIAYMLGQSMSSVTAALHRARLKLGVKSRAEIANAWRNAAASDGQVADK